MLHTPTREWTRRAVLLPTRWFARLRHRKKVQPSLVLRRSDSSMAVFWPMSGDGTFGEACWTDWKYKPVEVATESEEDSDLKTDSKECERETDPLTSREARRLRDLHETHYSWWTMVKGGAFMVVNQYPAGVEGQALPARSSDSDGGGSHV